MQKILHAAGIFSVCLIFSIAHAQQAGNQPAQNNNQHPEAISAMKLAQSRAWINAARDLGYLKAEDAVTAKNWIDSVKTSEDAKKQESQQLINDVKQIVQGNIDAKKAKEKSDAKKQLIDQKFQKELNKNLVREQRKRNDLIRAKTELLQRMSKAIMRPGSNYDAIMQTGVAACEALAEIQAKSPYCK